MKWPNESLTMDELLSDYPEFRDIEWLYCNGWYDGPLDGMVRTKGGSLYYANIIFEHDTGARTYVLTLLDEESQAYEDQKHEDFCKYVGPHWTFVGDVKHFEPGVHTRPQSEWHKFYDKYDWKTPRKLTGEIKGWYTS